MAESQLKVASKYFLHGILFSILGLVLVFLWAVLLIVLVVIGLFIGLIIGLLVLFFIVGGLNSFLTNIIWNMPVKTDWKSLLTHGFILSILLLVVHVPSMIVSLAAPSIATTIVLFVIYAFIDGLVAKRTAALGWREEEVSLQMIGETPKTFLKSCVNCGKDIPIASEMCPHCGAEQKKLSNDKPI